jgi:hypothetical protein
LVLLRCCSDEQLNWDEIHKYRVVIEKGEWNRQLGEPKRRWEVDIKMGLK